MRDGTCASRGRGESGPLRPCLGMRFRIALLAVVVIGVLAGSALAGDYAPRVECGQPRLLHLQRFEDGSARLWCGQRLLVRVAVPW